MMALLSSNAVTHSTFRGRDNVCHFAGRRDTREALDALGGHFHGPLLDLVELCLLSFGQTHLS